MNGGLLVPAKHEGAGYRLESYDGARVIALPAGRNVLNPDRASVKSENIGESVAVSLRQLRSYTAILTSLPGMAAKSPGSPHHMLRRLAKP